MKTDALIVAAGSGTRCESEVPKQYLPLAGRTIIEQSLNAFLAHPQIENVQLVVSEAHQEFYTPIFDQYEICAPVMGGETRSESVKAGLQAVQKQGATHVLIHDAARPFVSSGLITRVISSLEFEQCVTPVLSCVDTIKKGGEYVEATLDRTLLKRVQTPQGFHLETLMNAYKNCKCVTDEAQVMEQAGVSVKMIEGDENLFKITTYGDYKRAKAMYEKTRTKIGQGFDVHRLISGEGVTLGGVLIPCAHRLKGHSDADVVLHALVDAVLGAIGKDDIGVHFPPSDPQWKNADSSLFVRKAVEWMEEEGYSLQNADVTIICETPKIGPYREAMKARIAALLNVDICDVNIKATTTEQLGFTGRGEGIAAQAIVSVRG